MVCPTLQFVLGKDGGLVEVGSGTHATVFLAKLRRLEEPAARAQLVAVKVGGQWRKRCGPLSHPCLPGGSASWAALRNWRP